MKINGQSFTAISCRDSLVTIIDQRWLPHKLQFCDLSTLDEFCSAISDMYVRGAIVWSNRCVRDSKRDAGRLLQKLIWIRLTANYMPTRPTAINLKWALDEMVSRLLPYLKKIAGLEH